MSIATVVTRGFGSFGSANLVVTRGYTVGAAAAADVPFGWGSGYYKDWQKYTEEDKDRRWKKKRRDLKELDRLLAGIQDVVPQDVPEATPLRVAAKAIAKAADKLPAPKVSLAAFDFKALSREVEQAAKAVAQAERALVTYRLRIDQYVVDKAQTARAAAERIAFEQEQARLRALDEDDEDVLLLMA